MLTEAGTIVIDYHTELGYEEFLRRVLKKLGIDNESIYHHYLIYFDPEMDQIVVKDGQDLLAALELIGAEELVLYLK